MKYRITNRSHQEGMVSLSGKWETIQPGEVRYSEVKPGEYTGNLRVTNVVSVAPVSANTVPPVSNQGKTVYSQTESDKTKSKDGGK